MKNLKRKIFGLLLTLVFVTSNFSGVCAQAMDMNGSMQMDGSEMAHEEMTSPTNYEAPSSTKTNCEENCEIRTYQTHEKNIIAPQQTSTDTGILTYQAKNFVISNLLIEQWKSSRDIIVHTLVGSHQEGIKLII
jgi:hypothetical protein